MADYCTKCNVNLFEDKRKPDIDVYQIFKKLPVDHYKSVICEGCGMIGVVNLEGKLRVVYQGKTTFFPY